MSDGPTTAGAIVGKLSMDKDQWKRDKAEAKADAAELGALNPTIKVDAKVGDAIAKLEAVRAAQEKLNFSNDRLKIAYQKLDEVQTKGGASQSRLMQLHLAAARAESAHEAATRGLAAAEASLAAENDNVDSSNKRVASSSNGNVSRWQLIAAAIAALIPLLAPLAAYAVGVAGALAGMGAAGVLAIVGITQQIKQGTELGGQFKFGLDQLKGALDQLATTSAAHMLVSFQDAVDLLNAALPSLNKQIAVFSDALGVVGTDVLQGVLNGFTILNPLFVQATQYVEKLAAGFLTWTQNGGLQKFADYATSVFPEVAATIGSLVTMVMHVVDAFAPFGGTMLAAIKAVADAINAVPVDLLGTFTLAALGAALAFRGWTAIGPVIMGVKGNLDALNASAMGAKGGIIAAAVAMDALILAGTAAGASGALKLFGSSNDVNQWSAAIRKGDVNVNNLGITLQKTGGFFNDLLNNIDLTGSAARPFYQNVKDLDQALASAAPKDAAVAYKQLMEEGKKAGKSAADMAQLFPMATAAINAQKDAAAGASEKTKGTANSLADLTTVTNTAKAALDVFNQALLGLGQANLSESQANIQFQQSLADSTASIKRNGATLDLNTQAGRDNQRSLDGIASSAIALIAAHQKAGASTEVLTTDMAAARASFVRAAIAAGMSRDAAEKLADQYGLIPKNVNTAFNTSGAAAAEAAARALKAAYDNIDRQITIRVDSIITNSVRNPTGMGLGTGGLPQKAFGGTIGMSAGGSVHGPGSALADMAGLYRLANGEEVTSNVGGQAAKYRPTLKAINANMPRESVAATLGVRGQQATIVRPVFNVMVQGNGLPLDQIIDVRIEAAEAQTWRETSGGSVL